MGKAINIYNLALELINEYKVFQNKKTDIKIKIIGLRQVKNYMKNCVMKGLEKKQKIKIFLLIVRNLILKLI